MYQLGSKTLYEHNCYLIYGGKLTQFIRMHMKFKILKGKLSIVKITWKTPWAKSFLLRKLFKAMEEFSKKYLEINT